MNRRSLVACVAAALVGFASGAAGVRTPEPPCRTVEVGEDSNATAHVADELLAQGWRGVAGDGAERLYEPSCFAR